MQKIKWKNALFFWFKKSIFKDENLKLLDALNYIKKEINFEDKMKDSELDYLIVLTLYFNGEYEKVKNK